MCSLSTVVDDKNTSLAEETFDFAANVSAMVGVVKMGMLSSRLSRVHVLDALFDYTTYKVVVHTSSVEQQVVGSTGFIYRLASSEVWILMTSILLVTVLFHALNFYLLFNTLIGVIETFSDHIFRLLATTINQGGYAKIQRGF